VAAKDINVSAAQGLLKVEKFETTSAGAETQNKNQERARAQLRIARKNQENSQ
jgi:uncharacterized phage protein gp47/JayE